MKVTKSEVDISCAGPVRIRFEVINIVSIDDRVPNDAKLLTDEMLIVYLWRRLSNVLFQYILLVFLLEQTIYLYMGVDINIHINLSFYEQRCTCNNIYVPVLSFVLLEYVLRVCKYTQQFKTCLPSLL